MKQIQNQYKYLYTLKEYIFDITREIKHSLKSGGYTIGTLDAHARRKSSSTFGLSYK